MVFFLITVYHDQPFQASVFLVQPTATHHQLYEFLVPSVHACQRFNTSPQTPEILRSSGKEGSKRWASQPNLHIYQVPGIGFRIFSRTAPAPLRDHGLFYLIEQELFNTGT